jgi:hypothetical protein
MRALTPILLAVLAGLGIYVARSRVVFALKVGGITLVVLLAIRLLFDLPAVAELVNRLVWPVAGVLLAWIVLWYASTTYARRREQRRRGPVR